MGDAGSNFLGFLLGALTITGTFTRTGRGDSPYGVLTPLLVMAVPLYDTASVILIRLRQGRSPFLGDRSHFSHRLVERGLTPPWAVRTIDLVTLAGGLGALLLHRLGPFGAGVVVVQTACLLGVVAILEISTTPERRDGEAQRADDPRRTPGPARCRTTRRGCLTRPRRLARRRLRRLALGLTAALIVARAYWPSEGVREAETSAGLGWVLAVLLTAALACLALGSAAGRASGSPGPTRRSSP
jgi:hypothetical protein